MDNASTPVPSPDGAYTKANVKYGASCAGCRRRKQRCDAQTPSCSRCTRLKEVCVYEQNNRNLNPPLSGPLLIQTFDFLRSLIDPTSGPPDFDLRRLITQYLEDTPLPNFAGSELNTVAGEAGDASARREDGQPAGMADVDELIMHMSVAEDGQNGHFGVTSLYWQSPPDAVVQRLRRKDRTTAERKTSITADSDDDPAEDEWSGDEYDANILRSNASMLSGWETLALSKLELEVSQAEAEMIFHLLQTYFSWQYGCHCVVYRPVFIRDMALDGPYFNHFLLNVLCAYATRYSDVHRDGQDVLPFTQREAYYLKRAKTMLAQEIDKPSSIPTIQGMLLLGQRECASGNSSQGWMYTGMAFRAIRDMGIHLDCSRLRIFGFGTLTVEDREIRRRVFWSAFTWDKIISLALGRTPTFNAHQNVSPGMIVDDTEDEDVWRPHFWGGSVPPEMSDYPEHKSWVTLNYRHFIKLCEIIQTIIMRLYVGRPKHTGTGRFIKAIHARLLDWFSALPAVIKLDSDSLPDHCPPPHIFATNALYRAAWILLYRIFLPNSLPAPTGAPTEIINEASGTCTAMADELHRLFILYDKSFKLHNMTFTLAWSMYSAACINAMDFQSSDSVVSAAAAPRLGMSLHVLGRCVATIPGAAKSIDIVKHRLRQPRQLPPSKRSANMDLTQRKRNKLPATAPRNSSTLPLSDFPLPSSGGPSSSSALNDTVSEPDEWSRMLGLLQEETAVAGAARGGMDTGIDLLQGLLAMPSNTQVGGDNWTWSCWEGQS